MQVDVLELFSSKRLVITPPTKETGGRVNYDSLTYGINEGRFIVMKGFCRSILESAKFEGFTRIVCGRILILFTIILLFPAQGSADGPFRVGLSFPLSGPNAEFGIAAKNGVEFARSSFPAQFEGISFIFDDNRYDPKGAISSFHKLVKNDGSQFVFVWGSPTCMAVAPIAESSKTPLACLSGDPKPGLKYVFSFNSMAADYAEVAIGDIRSKAPKKISALYSDISVYSSFVKAIAELYGEANGKISEIALSPDAVDLRTEILSLKNSKPDYLLLFILPPQMGSVSKEMSLYNFKPHILGADTFSDANTAKVSNGLFSGAPYVDMIIPSKFRDQYTEKYGTSSNLSFAYNTYQFAIMVSRLFGAKEKLSSEVIVEKLKKYPGMSEDPTEKIAFKESPKNGQYFQFPIGLSHVPSLAESLK